MNKLNGYGEIKIGERVLPLKFGTNSDRLFCEYHNIDLRDIGGKISGSFGMYELSYFAYVTAMRMRNALTDISMDEFIEMLGEDDKYVDECAEIFKSSKHLGKSIDELTAIAEKMSKKKT